MCACVRAHTVIQTHLSNTREARSELGKVSLRSQEVRPKEWEASRLLKRVTGLLDQQSKSEKGSGTQDICLPGDAVLWVDEAVILVVTEMELKWSKASFAARMLLEVGFCLN